MGIRKIMTVKEPCLHKVCRPVEKFDGKLHKLLDDMKETLLDANGVGLAAPQVGILRQVVLVINEDDEIIELINPEIIQTSGEQFGLEGCLSVPGLWYPTMRHPFARVRGIDLDGNEVEVSGSGVLAQALQHETDHLDGMLYLDRLDKENRRAAMKQVRESSWF